MQDQLTQSRLKELLDYDPETGVFRWKVAVGRGPTRRKPGECAGSMRKDGYKTIRFGGWCHLTHRLAFLWMTGAWPKYTVDHIDGDPANTRWENLRDISHQQNIHNVGAPSRHGSSGFLGVTFDKSRKKWCAKITSAGVGHHLGRFPTPELAHAAYLKAKDDLHPTHMRLRNHGR